MELSLARELPSCELSTISTAASRSRHRDESLPRISAAILRVRGSRGGVEPRERRECQEREDADTQPLPWGAWAPHRHRSPSPSWTRHPGLSELSLQPGAKATPERPAPLAGRKFCSPWKQSKAKRLLAKEA